MGCEAHVEHFLVSAKQAFTHWAITPPLDHLPFWIFMHFPLNLLVSVQKKVLTRGILSCLLLIITFNCWWNKYLTPASSWGKIRLKRELLTLRIFRLATLCRLPAEAPATCPTTQSQLLQPASRRLTRIRQLDYLPSPPHVITLLLCLASSELLLLQASNVTVQCYFTHF